jgi:hypothetical protein
MSEVDMIYERKNFNIEFYYQNNYKCVIMDIWDEIRLKMKQFKST